MQLLRNLVCGVGRQLAAMTGRRSGADVHAPRYLNQKIRNYISPLRSHYYYLLSWHAKIISQELLAINPTEAKNCEPLVCL